MWSWSLNWGEITPGILVGTCPMTAADLKRIHAETGVSAILSLQHDKCLAYWKIDYIKMRHTGEALGLSMMRCPMRDFDIPDQRRMLPQAVTKLARFQADHQRTYVHCTAGLGRAPLTVLTYLTLVEGQRPEDAIQAILSARPAAVPAWEAYYGCREDLSADYHEVIGNRAYTLFRQGVNRNAAEDWVEAEAEVLPERCHRCLLLRIEDCL